MDALKEEGLRYCPKAGEELWGACPELLEFEAVKAEAYFVEYRRHGYG